MVRLLCLTILLFFLQLRSPASEESPCWTAGNVAQNAAVIPPSPDAITAENVFEVDEILRVGRGSPDDLAVNGQRMVVATPTGLAVYDNPISSPRFIGEGSYRDVEISPDGRLFLAYRWPNVFELFDAHSGQVVRVLDWFDRDVKDFILVSARVYINDGRLWIWDLIDGTVTEVFEHDDLSSIALHDNLLATGHEEGSIRLWKLPSLELDQTLNGNTDAVNIIAFNPDGTRLASGSADETARLWDLTRGVELAVYKGETSVMDVAFSDDRLIVSFFRDAQVYDSSTGAWIGDFDTPDGAMQVEFNGSVFIVRGRTKISAWDTEPLVVWEGYNGWMWDAKVAGDRLITMDHASGELNLWSMPEGHHLKTFEWPGVQYFAVSPDSSFVAVAPDQLRLVDLSQLALFFPSDHSRIFPVGRTGFTYNRSAFTPDGRLYGHDAELPEDQAFLWDPRTEARSPVMRVKDAAQVVFSPSGDRLAYFDTLGDKLYVWSFLETCEPFQIYQAASAVEIVTDIKFNDDGTKLIVGYRHGLVEVRDVSTGDVLVNYKHSRIVAAVAVSGDVVASGGQDTDIHLWNIETGEHFVTLNAHTNTISSLAFSGDGRWLTSTSYDGTARVWGVR